MNAPQVPVCLWNSENALNPPFQPAVLEGDRFQPSPQFGMPVGKAQNAAVVMPRRRKIDPDPRLGHRQREAGVVDAVLMLVDKHKDPGGRRVLDC